MDNSLHGYTIDYSLCEGITQDFLEKHQIMPIRNEGLYILVATYNKENSITVCREYFQQAIKFLYVDEGSFYAQLQYLEMKKELYTIATGALEERKKEENKSSVIIFMDTLFSFCIAQNVSDIHFESFEKSVVIRVRIDGELIPIFRFESALFSLISSIVKYFGNLDISQKRKPLNGRISREVQEMIYDMRISTMPTIHGESIVIRILDNGNLEKELKSIGFDSDSLQVITQKIHLNQGLILVTGPTGSGKTTTLYSMINSINTNNRKIITIEDPVEYKIDGIIQISINNEIGLDYQTVLKNVLRQDPDILLIGEIRDIESLQIAIQASLTGHLVLATLHTNSSLETITRLLDLNAKGYLIASTLKMVLAQRLIRILCPACKQKDPQGSYYIHKGCSLCNFTGYEKRTIISEVLDIDANIAQMITQKKDLYIIESYMKEQGFLSLNEKGMLLVEEGLTTLEEFQSKI